jgi:hypothetical protein
MALEWLIVEAWRNFLVKSYGKKVLSKKTSDSERKRILLLVFLLNGANKIPRIIRALFFLIMNA